MPILPAGASGARDLLREVVATHPALATLPPYLLRLSEADDLAQELLARLDLRERPAEHEAGGAKESQAPGGSGPSASMARLGLMELASRACRACRLQGKSWGWIDLAPPPTPPPSSSSPAQAGLPSR